MMSQAPWRNPRSSRVHGSQSARVHGSQSAARPIRFWRAKREPIGATVKRDSEHVRRTIAKREPSRAAWLAVKGVGGRSLVLKQETQEAAKEEAKAARTNEEKDFKMFTATAWAKQN